VGGGAGGELEDPVRETERRGALLLEEAPSAGSKSAKMIKRNLENMPGRTTGCTG